MAVNLSPVGGVAGQFFDNNGVPLSGGKIYTYAAGTTTNQVTYTSAAGTVAHTNPIVLDGGGRVPSGEIWLTDGLQYKFVLKNASDVLIGTYDNIVGINSNFVNFLTETEVQTATAGQTVFTLTTMQYQPGTNNLTVYVDGVNQIDGGSYSYVETSSTVVTFTAGLHVGALVKFTTAQTLSTGVTDASLVTYDPPFTGSIPTTVETKLSEVVSAQDFGATSSVDVAAINVAMAYAIANNAVVNFDFDATIRVPTDALNLQVAIDAINASPNVTITLNIEAGHVLTSGFRITNRDCSFMQITSTDATVTVSPSMTLVSNTDLSSDVPRSTLIGFLAVRSKMPTWNILVDMVGLSCVSGYELDYESDGVVNPSKGVINTAYAAGLNGVNCRVTSNSRLQAAQSVWTGAKTGNMAVTLNAFANLQNANLSGTDNEACLDVSRGSVVHALGANCSNGLYAGVYVRRAFVSCQSLDVSNCNLGVWASTGSFVGAANAIFDGCTTDVACDEGSWVGLGRAQKSGVDLDPADSRVQGASSGTAAPRAFNLSGGYGTIAYTNNLSGDAEALSANSGTQSITSASLQSIPTLTYATALSLTGKYIIHGGTIYGADVGVKITIDGNVILNDGARILGDDSAGNTISVIQIPACKCESTILIEAYNRASTTKNLGWRIYHSGAL